MRLYLNILGFGISVIQRLCKTSVKKNLYWEIKEKELEERFDGVKTVRKKQKVRIYGLDSNRSVRARLIEILMERVRYHKDKFVAKVLLEEMKRMVVKKSGKVEHSDNSHDDQVFSYLMALYVWYEGKNLAENFRIVKNTIKTDAEEELIENEIEDNIENVEEVNFDNEIYNEDSDLYQTLNFIEKNAKYITTEDIRDEQYYEIIRVRDNILRKNPELRKKMAKETGLDESMFNNTGDFGNVTSVTLPNTLFDMDNISNDEETQYNVVQGNLSSFWDKV